jgi:hypothetical protein
MFELTNFVQMIDMVTLRLAIGLMLLMTANITLGSVDALFTQAFNWKKFNQGVIKALVVIGCFILVYIAGVLNSELILVNINGEEVTLLTGIYLTIFFSAVWYAKEVFKKLANLINSKINIGDEK